MTRIPPVRRLLMDAQKLIRKPENWTKGTFARSASNRQVLPTSPRAQKFCSWGAIVRAAGDGREFLADDALFLLEKEMGTYNASLFNDAPSTTHPMIMRLFNKAIRRAKEQGI